MNKIGYDGTFEGWLSAVFEIYSRKMVDVTFVRSGNASPSLFGPVTTVETNEQNAIRVWQGICRRVSANAAKQIYRAFLSEQAGVEDHLLTYARYALSSPRTVEYDYAHPSVRFVIDTDKKVRREKHRMEAFVRFALTGDGIYYAMISPDFNVLPLIRRHFEQRYADQRWLIYDTHRRYGIYYDLHRTLPVTIEPAPPQAGETPGNGSLPLFAADEMLYQQLWQHYFQNVNIAARRNMKLHLRHMPVRYWRFLPEKNSPLKVRIVFQPPEHPEAGY